MSAFPGPTAFLMMPVTSTENGSGLLPRKTVHTSPVIPGFRSSIGMAGASTGWSEESGAAGLGTCPGSEEKAQARSVQPRQRPETPRLLAALEKAAENGDFGK